MLIWLGTWIRFIKIICILNVRGSHLIKYEGCIRSQKYGNCSSASCWSSWTFGVGSHINANNNTQPPVPGFTLKPIDGVEEGVRASITSIHRSHTLDVMIAALREQTHQDGLCGFRFIEECLSADLQTTNCGWIEVVLLHQGLNNYNDELMWYRSMPWSWHPHTPPRMISSLNPNLPYIFLSKLHRRFLPI